MSTNPPSAPPSSGGSNPALASGGSSSGSNNNGAMSVNNPNNPANAKKEKGVNVRVAVRCRPLSEQEKKENSSAVVMVAPKQQEVKVLGKQTKTYNFDGVYGEFDSQEKIYAETVAPIVDEVLQGFNCTVFAYGQTGTGKTYTMEGEFSDDVHCATAGIIPRAVSQIFERLSTEVKEYSVKVSFLELYNEELIDLMSDEKDKSLRIFQDQSGKTGVMVAGLEEQHVGNAQEVFTVVTKCIERRRTASTLMNQNSSRSHSIFTVTVHSKASTEIGEDVIKTGKLHLVDLAGSECIGRSGAINMRAKEAGNINKSLLTLGRVINALVDNHPHVPYRDSKLTRLLKESLGGTAKTCIIATISPSLGCLEETLSTLAYAHRAKDIKNKPQVNEKMTHRAYMNELLHQIQLLKRENEVLRSKNGIILPPEQFENMNEELKKRSQKIEYIELTLQAKLDELDDLQKHFSAQSEELEKTVKEREEVTGALQQTKGVLEEKTKQLDDVTHSLEEHKYIIHEHKQNENVIVTKAKALKGTLETVIQDKNALHEKIARTTAVEEHNTVTSRQFTDNLSSQLTSMEQRFEEFCERQAQALNTTAKAVSTFGGQQEEQCNELVNAVQQLQQAVSATNTTLQAAVTTFTPALQTGLDAVSQVNDQAGQTLVRAVEDLKEYTQSAVERVTQELANQQAAVTSWQQTINKQLADNLAAWTAFCTQQSEAMHKMQQMAVEQNQRTVASAEQSHKQLSAITVQQQESSQALTQSMMLDIQQLMTKYMHAHVAQLVGSIGDVQTNLQQSVHQSHAHCQEVSSFAEHQQHALQTFTAEQATAQRVVAEAHVSTQQRIVETQQASVAELKTLQEGVSDKTDVTLSQIAIGGVMVKKGLSECATVATDFSTRQTDTLQSLQGCVTNGCIRLEEQVADASDTRRQLLQDVNTRSSASQDDVQQMRASEGRAFFSMRDAVTTFVTQGLQQDVPTGRTPKKQPIQYPSTPTRTADTETLLQQYRQRKQQGQPILSLDSVEECVVSAPHSPTSAAGALEVDAADTASQTSEDSKAGAVPAAGPKTRIPRAGSKTETENATRSRLKRPAHVKNLSGGSTNSDSAPAAPLADATNTRRG